MRPFKEGLDYFELDCHMDEKVRLIQAEFGLKGFAVVVLLLQEIYGGRGYYMTWDEDRSLLFMSEHGATGGDKNLIQEIVAACIRRGIFSEELFRKYQILTSSGIQKRYLKAVARREKVTLEKRYLLISDDINKVSANNNRVNVRNNSKNADSNTQSREEKSREEKSKSNSAQGAHGPTAKEIILEHGFSSEVEKTVLEWVAYKCEKRQNYKSTGLKNLLSQIDNKIREYGPQPVIDVIRLSMSQNWQGIIWDRIRPSAPSLSSRQAANDYPPELIERLVNNWDTGSEQERR